jgi:hypothetical protein
VSINTETTACRASIANDGTSAADNVDHTHYSGAIADSEGSRQMYGVLLVLLAGFSSLEQSL